MSDPKQQQQADEEQIADLAVPDAQAEEVLGGADTPKENIAFTYGGPQVKYTPEHP
jgi:hypothetical protein